MENGKFEKVRAYVNSIKIRVTNAGKVIISFPKRVWNWLGRILKKPKNQVLAGGVCAVGADVIGTLMNAHTKVVVTTIIQAGVSHTFPVLVTTLPTWLYWVGFVSLLGLTYAAFFLLTVGISMLVTNWWAKRKKKNAEVKPVGEFFDPEMEAALHVAEAEGMVSPA